MNTQRVTFYMHDLSGGGVERMRLALIAELRSRGLDVTLVVASRTGSLTKLLPSDLPVVELSTVKLVRAIWPLARYLRTAKPDVLVSSLDHNNVVAILARFLACVSTRVVICQHNALSSETALGWRYRAIPFIYWLLQAGAHGIVAVSNGVADDLAAVTGISRKRITTIYNPVVGPEFTTRLQTPTPHPWLSTSDIPAFIFAGRLIAQKDPGTLLEAFALVVRCRAARLLVLGEGPLLRELEEQAARLSISAHVSFVGFQADPLPWIRDATALVLSSRYEGLGNVIIESLACGTPVISTDCPHGPSEILMGGEFGSLVPVSDVALLAAAMSSAVDAPTNPGRLMSRGAAFTAASCADAHVELFERLRQPKRQSTTTTHAFGLPFSSLMADQVLARIMEDSSRMRSAGVRLVVTPNLEHIRLMRRPDFAEACSTAELICPDGLPVLLYARLRGLKLSTRVTGCELFHRLARHPDLHAQRLFIVVESTRTVTAVSEWAARLGLSDQICVSLAPGKLGQNVLAQNVLTDEIRAWAPTILVMTLGAPVSETFVHQHRHALPPCWALCVGQAVRVELGLTVRAPIYWQALGLEWLWRIRQEPARMLSRYVKAAAWFPVAIYRDIASAAVARSRRYSASA